MTRPRPAVGNAAIYEGPEKESWWCSRPGGMLLHARSTLGRPCAFNVATQSAIAAWRSWPWRINGAAESRRLSQASVGGASPALLAAQQDAESGRNEIERTRDDTHLGG